MAALGASRLVGSAVSSSNIASSGLSTHPVFSYTASNIRENGLRNIVPPLSVLLLLHSLSILRDDSDVANLVVPPWGGDLEKSESRISRTNAVNSGRHSIERD